MGTAWAELRRAGRRQTIVRTGHALLAALLVGVTACGIADDSSGETGVRGVVLAGPQCPVETVESPCPDQPLPDLPVRISTQAGDPVGELTTDEVGRFSLPVPPGRYVVEALLGSAGPGSAEPVAVTVGRAGFADVTVRVDTGIR